MHGICMWFVGCDMSLAWTMARIDSGLPRIVTSWIAMVIVGSYHRCVFGWFSCFLILGCVTSPVAMVGETLWSTRITWVELVVM